MNPSTHHLSQLSPFFPTIYRYFTHGASSSSTHFRLRHGSSGELSEEEDNTVTMTTMIEQHKRWMMEEGGTPLQLQHDNLGSKKEEYMTIQGRKEEEYVTIEVEPDAPQMQGVASQSSFNHSGTMADSESGIMSYAVLIILLVAEVILGLDFFGVI